MRCLSLNHNINIKSKEAKKHVLNPPYINKYQSAEVTKKGVHTF